MSHEIDSHVVRAIVDLAVFLEFSGEESVNCDDATQALEQLAATLQGASEEVRVSLCSGMREISNNYDGERANFVKTLGEALGLANHQAMETP